MTRLLFLLFHLSLTISVAQTKESSIDSLFLDWNFPENPGGAVAVVKDGKLVFSKGYGTADLEHDVPIKPNTVFYIGSVSKQFVTFCILLLEEDGKLNLDDNIQQYFPDFPDYGTPLTIRHFIHHTSGVRDYLTLMDLKGRSYLDEISKEEVYQLIKQQEELNFEPGEKYLYSNSCYFMLALIVEKVSGMSIKDFAQKEIFGPLGMKNSLFYDDNSKIIKNRAFSYQRTKDGFENLINRFQLVGSGGVYSTVEDLYLWDQNFYHNKLGNGTQALIEKMHEEGLLNNGESSGYAFALNIGKYKGLKTVGHGGALAGYRSDLLRFPDEAFSVIILANRSDANPSSYSYLISDTYLKDKFKPSQKSNSKTKKTAKKSTIIFKNEEVVGTYEVNTGMHFQVAIVNDTLKGLQKWNNESYPLIRTEGNAFQDPDDVTVKFIFSEKENGSAQILKIDHKGNVTTAKRLESFDKNQIKLSDYIGNFYSKELDVNYHVFIENNQLMVEIPHIDPLELSPFETDKFSSNFIVLNFQRQNGIVTAFEVDAGRVQNLRFKKQ